MVRIINEAAGYPLDVMRQYYAERWTQTPQWDYEPKENGDFRVLQSLPSADWTLVTRMLRQADSSETAREGLQSKLDEINSTRQVMSGKNQPRDLECILAILSLRFLRCDQDQIPPSIGQSHESDATQPAPMNRLLDDSIAWLYQDKNAFEIWKITDCVRPDDLHLTFDTKWAPQDATTYTVRGETDETGCFAGKILKNGQEVGRADAQVYNRPDSIALIGRWLENGETIDFVARLSLRRKPRSE